MRADGEWTEWAKRAGIEASPGSTALGHDVPIIHRGGEVLDVPLPRRARWAPVVWLDRPLAAGEAAVLAAAQPDAVWLSSALEAATREADLQNLVEAGFSPETLWTGGDGKTGIGERRSLDEETEEIPGMEAPELVISALGDHERGADDRHQLGWLIARLVDASNRDRRLPRRVRLHLGVGVRFFDQIAKIRAARFLGTRLLEELSAEDGDPEISVHASTGQFELSTLDPWNNLVRVSLQIAAAALGGADAIDTRGLFLPGDRSEATRLGLLAQKVLAEESWLARVHDPARGSWFLEARTSALAEEAWEIVSRIEKEGGMAAYVADGGFQRDLEGRSDIRSSESVRMVGVDRFPGAIDADLPIDAFGDGVARRGDRFERARTRLLERRRSAGPIRLASGAGIELEDPRLRDLVIFLGAELPNGDPGRLCDLLIEDDGSKMLARSPDAPSDEATIVPEDLAEATEVILDLLRTVDGRTGDRVGNEGDATGSGGGA